jgi:hypothetical protein
MRKHKRVEFGSFAYGSSFKIGRAAGNYTFCSSGEITGWGIDGFSSIIG